ncbi:MAG: tetratricopeptide repeat protein [Oscillochloris sp.]|nr:tetratricopeptide repeat protein [Oscillochloris sp.]
MTRLRQLLGWLFLLGLVAASTLFALRPDPRDALRSADALFLSGHSYEALRVYQSIDTHLVPEAALRLGMIRAMRGEYSPAERAIRTAMQAGLRPVDYQIALIYLGQTLANNGNSTLAVDTWALADDCRSPAACAYRPIARILAAEQLLYQADYPAAEEGYKAALADSLPSAWFDFATYRLALLLASRDAPAAEVLIKQAGAANLALPEMPLLAPLLPTTTAWQTQLTDTIMVASDHRPYQLGQLYLSLGLYVLAEDQFTQVPPDSSDARAADVFVAYTRWRAGDHKQGLVQLEQIVHDQPDDPQARMLLALAYLSADDGEAALTQIDVVTRMLPRSPDIHLAWASWYAAKHEYPQASLEYSQALAQAAPERRGRYALLGARFHLDTAYDLCESGLPLAESAVAALPTDSAAWTVLAAHQYYCGHHEAALASAQYAVDSGGGAESVYYLGMALSALGQQDRARSELIHVANLAPASIWRERAETALVPLITQ